MSEQELTVCILIVIIVTYFIEREVMSRSWVDNIKKMTLKTKEKLGTYSPLTSY